MIQSDASLVAQEIILLCEDIARTNKHDLDALEALYAVLDPILDNADEAVIDAVLRDASFLENKAQLHLKRAGYEYDREIALADTIIAEHDTSPAERFRSYDWYDKALDFETKALASYHCQNILFVGAGPFPTSPMAFLKNNPEAHVSCMERYGEACLKARKVADIFGMHALTIINAESTHIDDFSAHDCVIVGLVVGAVEKEKTQIVSHFLNLVPPSSLLCFRTAHGPGRIVYPSVDLGQLQGLSYKVLESPPHKSFTLIVIERDA